ncbi:helix-turn-helix domain-containing protein [Paenibacillus sp. FSL L8-0708]|uniref:helix-turn-helix domain-containing protein n=1 Tax=Paenibacillus sp. FSL L8-0708 TaxID=2975311 RepID=UPI0030FC2CA3
MNGFAIKAIRIGKGMTQVDFAAQIGISAQWLSAVESGTSPVSDRVRIRIGQLYGDDPEASELIRRAKLSDSLNV